MTTIDGAEVVFPSRALARADCDTARHHARLAEHTVIGLADVARLLADPRAQGATRPTPIT